MEKGYNFTKDDKGIPCVYHEWQSLNGETLGNLFSPSKYSRSGDDPDQVIEQYVKNTDERSIETRSSLKGELNVSVGGNTRQTVDLFIPENVSQDAPVLVFYHGGYWQFLSQVDKISDSEKAFSFIPRIKNQEVKYLYKLYDSKESHSMVARHLVPLGAIVAVAGYTIAPKGSVTQMIQECKEAVAFCARRYPKSRGIFVSGHSAGGHLAAMVLTTDWEKEFGLPSNLIKGACPLSGVFDLRPLVTTYINEPLHLTSTSALESSPVAHIPKIVANSKHCKIRCLYGDHEPPSFEIMCIQFCQLLREEGMDISCQKVKDADHFELFLSVWEEHSVVTKKVLYELLGKKRKRERSDPTIKVGFSYLAEKKSICSSRVAFSRGKMKKERNDEKNK
ncbi:Kynurenine formamidase [Holothuria leucospilota]|uniref:Kynurenine formamidase n=1 Tax=Holothuria leucospilota TaxID=206669 RepID=A0A9Q1H862_HOLLE|nr:Kynurenine formamidase [Holothuria leucospilota]